MHFCSKCDLRNEMGSGAEMCPKLLLGSLPGTRRSHPRPQGAPKPGKGALGQLLAKFFPVLSNSPGSYCQKKTSPSFFLVSKVAS